MNYKQRTTDTCAYKSHDSIFNTRSFKMKKKLKLMTCAITLTLTACGSVPLPDNVTTTDNAIGSIRYSHTPAVSFDKVKRCIALNINNDNVRLTDNAGSFVGYKGRYYNINNSHTDFAPNTLVFIDDNQQYLVVNGNTGYTLRMIGYAVRFRLQLQTVANENKINLLFDTISRAQLHTGSSTNNGFNPIYTQYGAHPDEAVKAIDAVKNNLTQCLNN